MKKLNLILKTKTGKTETISSIERIEYMVTNLGTYLEVNAENGPYTVRMSEIECVALAESV